MWPHWLRLIIESCGVWVMKTAEEILKFIQLLKRNVNIEIHDEGFFISITNETKRALLEEIEEFIKDV